MWADHEVQHADNIQADISLIESKTESAGKAAQHPTSLAHAADTRLVEIDEMGQKRLSLN
jgi:hypothetical protein